MRTWQIQSARSHFSEMFDAAARGTPQRVTRHGRQAVILVSEEEWMRRGAAGESFGAFLGSFPGPAAAPPRRPARVLRDPPF
jgi:prevent-host-death family protein